jgi:hypothetical protein
MALGSTQHLTEIITRNIFFGVRPWCVGLTTLSSSCAKCLETLGPSGSWSLKGLSRPVMRQLYLTHTVYLCFPFLTINNSYFHIQYWPITLLAETHFVLYEARIWISIHLKRRTIPPLKYFSSVLMVCSVGEKSKVCFRNKIESSALY